MTRTRVPLLPALTLLLIATATGCSQGSQGPTDLIDIRHDLAGIEVEEHEVRLPTGVMRLWVSEPVEEVTGGDLVDGQTVSGGDGVVVVRWDTESDPDLPVQARLLVASDPALTTVEVRSGGSPAGGRETRATSGGFAVAVEDSEDIQVAVVYDGIEQVVGQAEAVTMPVEAQLLYDPPTKAVLDESCRTAGQVPTYAVCLYSTFRMPWAPGAGWSGGEPWRVVQLSTAEDTVQRRGDTYSTTDSETTTDPAAETTIEGPETTTYVLAPGSGKVRVERALTMTRDTGAGSTPVSFVARVRLLLAFD